MALFAGQGAGAIRRIVPAAERIAAAYASQGQTMAGSLGSRASSSGTELTRTGGVLGGTLTYTIEGDPFELFAFLPSTNTGPTPLSILDPLDPRTLGVGIDLLSTLVVSGLGPTGTAVVAFPLPADPSLGGLPIHAQAMTLPGAPTLVDELSNVTAQRLALPGDCYLSIGELSQDVAAYGTAPLPDGTLLLGGGSVYLGAGGIPSADLRIFDPQTQGFEDLAANLSYAGVNPAAVALADGRVLFCGGIGVADAVLSAASIYDPVTGTASAAAPMPGPRVQHTATLLADGRVFVTGGVKALNAADPISGLSDILGTSAIYDPVADSWSGAASMSLPRVGHAATLLPSGRVLISGGLEIGSLFGVPIPSIVNSCVRYNPANNTMIGTANFSGDRALHGQVLLSTGQVLVAGGADGDVLTQVFNPLNSCRLYDEGSNSWTNVASLPEPRTYPNLVEAGGKVHVLSGLSTIDLIGLTGMPVTAIASSNVSGISWTTVGAMQLGRPLSAAFAVEGGERIVVLGPGDNGLPAADRTADVYVP